MNQRPDAWRDEHFLGWPPPVEIYLPSPLPPEFREENRDLKIPRKDEELDRTDNFRYWRPFF